MFLECFIVLERFWPRKELNFQSVEGQAIQKEAGRLEAGFARWAFALCLDLKLMRYT